MYDVLEGARRLSNSVSADDNAGGIALENAVVRRRGPHDWHIILHAHGHQAVLTGAFGTIAPQHPELFATTVAFEEGREITVSRHLPVRTEPISTHRFPPELYATLAEEFRFEPTNNETILLSPAQLEGLTLAGLRNRFQA